VSLTFTGAAEVNELEELRLSALTEVINIRIIDVLREKLGLIYGGGMETSMTRIPYSHYTVGVTLPTGPENVDKVLAATFAEIERMRTQGPDQADLDKVKRTGSRTTASRCARTATGWGAPVLADGRDRPGSHPDARRARQALSAAEVQDAARRYLNTENYVQVVLYPEKKAGAPSRTPPNRPR
jgi:zinc protease